MLPLMKQIEIPIDDDLLVFYYDGNTGKEVILKIYEFLSQ
jgi:hypothetical protein